MHLGHSSAHTAPAYDPYSFLGRLPMHSRYWYGNCDAAAVHSDPGHFAVGSRACQAVVCTNRALKVTKMYLQGMVNIASPPLIALAETTIGLAVLFYQLGG